MSAALGLLRLQQVDSRIDQLEGELGQIEAELEDSTEADTARQAVDAAEAEQKDAEQNRLAAEEQAHAQRTKLQIAESALYGGTVRNPKELQDLQAEVVSLRKHLVTLDAAELSWMEKLEATDEPVRAARSLMEHVLLRRQQVQRRLHARQAELQRDKESLDAERLATASAIEQGWVLIYENLRRSRRGVAVTEVSDNACSACGTALTAALQQSARHASELVYCPSCGRILYGD